MDFWGRIEYDVANSFLVVDYTRKGPLALTSRTRPADGPENNPIAGGAGAPASTSLFKPEL